ncbi:hypothetical protein [Clostridium tertium]|uniref:Uncharacterized protein n=1 Tax=Clostridium tertium TaxID=1559 RepID=A0A6N2YBJ1_9CLOT
MLTIRDKALEEKLKQLRKAIEIVGGNSFLSNLESDEELAAFIINNALSDSSEGLEIQGKNYALNNLLKIKINYEKNYIKTKKVFLQKITYKINKYNTYLDSLIRKYKKNGGIEEYRAIKQEIEERYLKDINDFILSEIEINEDIVNTYYGEYLISKKEDFINSIISNLI